MSLQRNHVTSSSLKQFNSAQAGLGPQNTKLRTPCNAPHNTNTKLRKLSLIKKIPPAMDPSLTMNSYSRIRINVSGEIYETYHSTLERYPLTLLGNNERREKYYDKNKDEYFFNRNREAFDSILFFYQSPGKLLRPSTISLRDFLEELEFFQMGDDLLDRFKSEIHYTNKNYQVMEYDGPKYLQKLWYIFEHPRSSMAAMLLTLFAVTVIIYSIVCFCLETIPSWKNSYIHRRILEISETVCVVWFTIELILRAIAAPSKRQFSTSILNIMDAVSIIPYYLTQLLRLIHVDDSILTILTVLRLVRVLRIFKLARHIRVLNILFNTIKTSAMQLFLLAFFVAIAMTLFASAMFYAESSFGSIPAAFWWSVITLTNVGYGDSVPASYAGKIIGSMCAISGVVTLALPIPVVVSSFMYFNNLDKEMAEDGKFELEEGAKKKIEMMRNIFGLGKQKLTFSAATRARRTNMA